MDVIAHFGGKRMEHSLLAMIALLAAQSSARIFIHNSVLFIDTSNNDWYSQAHWLIGTQYLSIIGGNYRS